mmetsp:Transcript_17706/g.44972  ORF Transcript_17706/g.44972 Transcript_17706/m.44972 type:complete len:344 (+) Transcript_17706:170-1201(+)
MHRKSVLSSTPWAWQRKSLHQECTAPSKRSAPSAPGRNTSSPSSPPQTPSFPRTLPTPSSLSASSPSTQCALRLPTSASPPGRSFTAHSTSPAILLAPPAQKYTRMSNLVSAGRGMPTASRPSTSDQHSSTTGATESTYRAPAACALWTRCPGIPRRSRSASSTPPSNSKPPTAPWPMPSEMQPPLPPQHTALRLSGKQKKPLSYSITSSELSRLERYPRKIPSPAESLKPALSSTICSDPPPPIPKAPVTKSRGPRTLLRTSSTRLKGCHPRIRPRSKGCSSPIRPRFKGRPSATSLTRSTRLSLPSANFWSHHFPPTPHLSRLCRPPSPRCRPRRPPNQVP